MYNKTRKNMSIVHAQFILFQRHDVFFINQFHPEVTPLVSFIISNDTLFIQVHQESQPVVLVQIMLSPQSYLFG